MKYLLSFIFPLLAAVSMGAQSKFFLLVGTYDSPKSEGIFVYDFNSSDGSSHLVGQTKTSNPSFLAIAPGEKFIYAVNENAPGQVSSFSFDKKTGHLKKLSQQSSNGDHPCYISVDKTGKWVFAGNYSSGSFSIFPVKKGNLLTATQIVTHHGSGPDSSRQKSPHVHAVVLNPANNYLYVPDLGIDKIMTYTFNARTGKAFTTKAGFFQSQPGSGPRHIAIHPNGKFIYLVNELQGSVTVIRDFGNADLQAIQDYTTLPLYYKGVAGSADIHISPDGKFLYCSNRGSSNTIAIFSINEYTGKITDIGHQSTLGLKPRNFNFDPTGKFLLVANQDSDEIVIFNRDIKTGLLTDSGKRIAVGKPVCLKWISR